MTIAHTIVIALLSLFGSSVDTHRDLWKPAVRHPTKASWMVVRDHVKDKIGPAAPWVNPGFDRSLRRYTFNFEGKTTVREQPVSGALVRLRLTTSEGETNFETRSNEAGQYSIEVSLNGLESEPIDWSMTAQTTDLRQVEFVGRKILMREDDTIMVQNPIDLQPS